MVGHSGDNFVLKGPEGALGARGSRAHTWPSPVWDWPSARVPWCLAGYMGATSCCVICPATPLMAQNLSPTKGFDPKARGHDPGCPVHLAWRKSGFG